MKSFSLTLFSLFTLAASAQDLTPPVANCKNISVQLDQWGYAAIAPEDLDNGSYDDDAIAGFSASQPEFDCGHIGDVVVTLTITDASGNSSGCDATVTVQDLLPPLNPVGLEVVVDLDEFGYAYVSPFYLDGGSEEGCLVDIQSNLSEFNCDNIGDNVVELTYIDFGGNSATTNALVTIQDITAPNAVCNNISVELDNTGHATVDAAELDGGSTDACGIASTEASLTEFDANTLGDNTVVLTITDIHGNQGTCEATVTVTGSAEPVAVCQNATISLTEGTASITSQDIDGGSANYADLSASVTSFTCSSIGENIVVLTATNESGATSTCEATVTVQGAIPTVSILAATVPSFCQGDQITLTADAEGASSYLWSGGETTSTLDVSSGGLYTATVSNEYGCTATASNTVSYNKSNLISAYTIIGIDAISVKRNTVSSGGVAIIKAGAKATFDRNSVVTDPTTFVKAPVVDLKGGSIVTNKILASATLNLPAVLSNPYNSKKNITVADNATVTITDSVYASIVIGKNAKVTFTQPRIYATDYWAKEGSVVNFVACTQVSVIKTVLIGKNSKTNLNQNKVTFYVKDNSASNEFTFEAGATFFGNAYAAAGDIVTLKATAAAPTQLTGQFIAKKVTADEYTTWGWNTNCDNSCGNPSVAPAAPSSTERIAQEPVTEEAAEVKRIPDATAISAYPNPFNTTTTIRFVASADEKVKLSVYNLSGQEVQTLFDGITEAGNEYNFRFDGTNLPAGMYLYYLETGGKVLVNKLMLTK